MSILVGATSACAGAAGSQAAAADLGDTIDQSLRFSNGPSTRTHYLQDSDITIQATSTFSGWIKIGDEHGATKGPIFGASKDSTGGDNATALGVTDDGRFYSRNTGGDEFWDNRFRDHSAWYHLVLQFDSSRNMTLFVNGVQQSSTKSPINVGSEIIIGRNRTGAADEAFQGYMAALYYVDGSILAPTNFGKYNDDGVWVPQDYTGSYGTNGFKLTFDSSQANGIGHDSSGQGNHFGSGGFDTAAISSTNGDNDIDFADTPTSNYATFNPLRNSAHDLADANLKGTSNNNYTAFPATIDVDMSVAGQKYYVEYFIASVSSPYPAVAVVYGGDDGIIWGNAQQPGASGYKGFSIGAGGARIANPIDGSSATTNSFTTSFSANDVIALTINTDTRELIGYRNGTQFSTVIHTFNSDDVISFAGVPDGPVDIQINFGQMPFIQTPPSGFKELQTNNLPEPTIKNGKEHFDVVTYNGSGTETKTLTGLEFAPDLVWIKHRNGGSTHSLGDTVRGAGANSLRPDTTNTAGTGASTNGYISAFTSDGFTVHRGASGGVRTNGGTGETYVAWCWKAGTSYTPTVTGFTSPSASINTEAGFGIYTFTGNNTASSFTHGLDSTPELIIAKNLTSSSDWAVFGPTGSSSTPTPTDTYLRLNEQTDANKNGQQILTGNNNTTVSVASFGDTAGNDNYVYYVWHSVEGFSKFGRYTGNNSSNGPFVYTGFRPAFVMVKSANTTEPWTIFDSARSPNNPADKNLHADNSGSEGDASGRYKDFLSNGFKIRGSSGEQNSSGSPYLYMAFAESPFGGENAPPATAR